jgi:RimJ/RimL family protein N-acetyltransferase
MFSLNIANERIWFKDIKPDDLPLILKWYNKVDYFMYATGVSQPITLEVITQKYAEVAICSSEFFVGIFEREGGNMVGILKGSLQYKHRDAVWISSIVIDTLYQKKGYGTAAIELLFDHLKSTGKVKNAYLAVIEDNIQGKNFWLKQNFRVLRRMESRFVLMDKKRSAVIMHRGL